MAKERKIFCMDINMQKRIGGQPQRLMIGVLTLEPFTKGTDHGTVRRHHENTGAHPSLETINRDATENRKAGSEVGGTRSQTRICYGRDLPVLSKPIAQAHIERPRSASWFCGCWDESLLVPVVREDRISTAQAIAALHKESSVLLHSSPPIAPNTSILLSACFVNMNLKNIISDTQS